MPSWLPVRHRSRPRTPRNLSLLPPCPAAFAPHPQVAASAAIPLRGLLDQRRLSGAWRLKEATAGVVEADRLDLGRATVQLAWCVCLYAAAWLSPGLVRVCAWLGRKK